PGAFGRRRAPPPAFGTGAHFALWRLGVTRFNRHERQAHRTYRLPRYRSRATQELRLLQRNHILAASPVSVCGIPRRRRHPDTPFPAVSPAWHIRWRNAGGMTWARHLNWRAASATRPRLCAALTCRTAGARDATGS